MRYVVVSSIFTRCLCLMLKMEKEILDNNRKRPIELISAGNKRARLDRRNQKDRDRRMKVKRRI